MRRKASETDALFVPPEIERLAEAVRSSAGTEEGAEQALTAFREAYDAADATGPRRPRRRDDWRPARDGFSARVSLRGALGAACATVTLGGVALAAGTGVLPTPFDPVDVPEGRPRSPSTVAPSSMPEGVSSDGAPEQTGETFSAPAPKASVTVPVPLSAKHEALCRVWGKENHRHQGAAFRELADAAGGENAVDAYCGTSSGHGRAVHPSPAKPDGTAHPSRPKESPAGPPTRGRGAEHAHRGEGHP